MKTKVSVIRCKDYSDSEQKIRESLNLLGGLDHIVKPSDKVLLKVNLLAPVRSDASVTTHPAIVSSMINLVRECEGIPIVGDASGMNVPGTTKKAYEISGIKTVVEHLNAEFQNFETCGYSKVSVPNGKCFKELYIAKPVMDADVIISLPKLKTHSLMLYTGAIKNFFGTVPIKIRKEAHLLTKNNFAEALIDIYSAIEPDLAVMDGVVCMEGDGPLQGKQKNLGIVSSSFDCASLDIVMSKIMGFDPREVPSNAASIDRGLCKPNEIEVVGESIENVKTNFQRPASWKHSVMDIIDKMFGNLYNAKPYIKISACINCGICIKNCSVGAIDNIHYPKINYDKCIMCFCCHEMCLYGAVGLKKSLPAELKYKMKKILKQRHHSGA